MKNHEVVSQRSGDDERLAELEKVIAKGQKTFVEVGLALAEIRDLRLYKREYSGFEEYCQKKWGWKQRYAYRLIDGAEVAKVSAGKVSTIVTTERPPGNWPKRNPSSVPGLSRRLWLRASR